ncbi:hypothetical protein FGIG_09228 [Fasciola gigantica]|uniref:Uncharacterized protein n=1 Tax=Fasciola gigantica TaxID=46835 RepID=A0A504YXB3_FASGI|nr:hypothetical protein FGIG_09228 [Fasciola gigantica]
MTLFVLSTAEVVIVSGSFMAYLVHKRKFAEQSDVLLAAKRPKRLAYMTVSERTVGRLDLFFFTTVIRLFSEIQLLCLQLQEERQSEESTTITESIPTASTRSFSVSTLTGQDRSSMISSVHADDPMSSLESLSLEYLQRLRGVHDGPRRSIIIMGEPGTTKVPLIISEPEAPRRVSLTLDPTILNLVKHKAETVEDNPSGEIHDAEKQERTTVRRHRKKPVVRKSGGKRRQRKRKGRQSKGRGKTNGTEV